MTILLTETNFSTVQTINEEVNGEKKWFIEGVFAQHSVVNKNRRLYPKEVLQESVLNYQNDFVKTGRAVGELEHPPTSKINLDRIAVKIENMREDGNAYYGKARVLNTPCGKIVQGLLEGGVQLGVSTRADGEVRKNSQGINEVQTGLRMGAVDVVANPSAPDAFVQGLMEGADFVWDTMDADHEFLQSLKEDFSRVSARELQEAKIKTLRKFVKYITETTK